MKALLLCALLAPSAWAAKAAKGAAKAPAEAPPANDDEKLVDYFTKSETSDLDPKAIPRFMELDLSKMSPGRRAAALGKRLELKALRKAMESKTKPPIRRVGQDPLQECGVEEGSAQQAKIMATIGFMPVTQDEVAFLAQRTKCTECELSDEFTYTRLIVPGDKAKKIPTEKHMFIHAKDPLMALVSQYRAGGKGGTDFFSVGFFGACR
ncbi:MAG: hypothetical protein FD126_1440 [Elusimicrobia bacterium]|nr:MAG: hypothetical protein FD126_1440 [Elusimicrobiota bacterium]